MLLEIIPSHKVAQWLLVHIHRLLDYVGLEKDQTTEEIIYIAIIVAVALFLGWIARKLILYCTKKIIQLRNNDLAQAMMRDRLLIRCSHIIPPIVLLALLPFAFTGSSLLKVIVFKGLLIYTSIVVCMSVCAIIKFVWGRVDEKRNTKNLPLKGIMDTMVGIVWIITIIICISILVDKSPVALLTGLGAFAAVLMLVFKDSILGLVGGLQLSQNDMLRVGDWIVVPSTLANGIVIDVSLSAVKVQNFDNTIVTLPPYSLISSSFQNWRGMSDSGCRRIARDVIIDSDTVMPATPEFIADICEKYPIIKPYVQRLQATGHPDYNPGLAVVNGTIETNLGLFRGYMCQYLLNHPEISNEQQILVRIMVPTGEGIPLQIYCFTATTAWTAYEAIQSEVLEHVMAVAPKFGLRLFNDPSGTDVTQVTLTTAPKTSPAIPASSGKSSTPDA